LWEVRGLYPQTEIDAGSGAEVRVFDRIVYEALATLGAQPTQDDAAAATLAAVKNEPALADPDGALFSGVFEARHLFSCERARQLSTDPIERVYVDGRGSSDPIMGQLGGGQTVAPFAPGPVQLWIDAAHGAGGDRLYCARFVATIGGTPLSVETAPDFFGGATTPPDWNVDLVPSTDVPVELGYHTTTSGISVQVNVGDDRLDLDLDSATQELSTTLELPANADRVYYAIANATTEGLTLENIHLDTSIDCPNAPSGDGNGSGNGTKQDKGGGGGPLGCAAAGMPSLLALVGLLRRRKR